MLKLMEISESNKQKLINELKERCEETEQDILLNVKNILEKVKKSGDKALFDFTKEFDKVELKDLEVSKDEIEACFDKVEENFIEA